MGNYRTIILDNKYTICYNCFLSEILTHTMSLAHPALNTTGKMRGRKKFANSAAAAKHRELQSEWDRKQREWEKMSPVRPAKPVAAAYKPPSIPENRKTMRNAVSVDSGVTGAVTIKQTQHYTGDRLLGITILHKSCLQPVFSQQEAIDAASMRR